MKSKSASLIEDASFITNIQKDMMLKLAGWFVIASVCVLIFSGCDDTTLPPETADIVISFDIAEMSDENTKYLVATLKVEHRGGLPIKYNPCPFMFPFSMRDEQGNQVIIYNPIDMPCYGPDVSMDPRQHLRRTLLIDGRTWDSQGKEISLTPGRYTLSARFSYSIGGSAEKQPWRQVIEFDWQ